MKTLQRWHRLRYGEQMIGYEKHNRHDVLFHVFHYMSKYLDVNWNSVTSGKLFLTFRAGGTEREEDEDMGAGACAVFRTGSLNMMRGPAASATASGTKSNTIPK